jgi:hypothetical protein
MKRLVSTVAALALVAPAAAWAQATFTRPDCPAADAALSAEARCIRDVRKQWQQSNFDALQEAGLVFRYMARPDLDEHPAAKEVLEKKVEGSFTVRFSVAPDGTVYNVATVDVTDGVAPLAMMWADTIGEWTFAKMDKAVNDVEHRRIYVYPRDDAESKQKRQGGL